MSKREAACEPCRTSKVACDRARPVCCRCRDRNERSTCIYRVNPFKRRRSYSPALTRLREPVSGQKSYNAETTGSDVHAYPNPGYLGSSSHVTIFERVAASNGAQLRSNLSGPQRSPQGPLSTSYRRMVGLQDIAVLHEIRVSVDIPECIKLISEWMTTGSTLPLSGIIIKPCLDAVIQLFCGVGDTGLDISTKLHMNTRQPLIAHTTSKIEEFCAQFCGVDVRWETLGLFFVALTRAATDVYRFEKLYSTAIHRRDFLKYALHISDCCLEIALAGDCLNDLQLMLQYENWVAHSLVDGDQSYNSWRKLGDVLSSLSALGYYDQLKQDSDAPAFLDVIRNASVARAYSADKNVSIFLGRSARTHRSQVDIQAIIFNLEEGGRGYLAELDLQSPWKPSGHFDHSMETQWSARCAVLKERILDLSKQEASLLKDQEASKILTDIEAQWWSLPTEVRLDGDLKLCDSRTSVERDFIVSARLNYLHVRFLSEFIPLRSISEPPSTLINTSINLLHLVVEAIILKHHLANSGTGLVWKVSYYGLPAAGVICLAILNRSSALRTNKSLMSKATQDLSVLVKHVEVGALIDVGEPNYALLAGATGIISTLLENIFSDLTRDLHQPIQQPEAIHSARFVDGGVEAWDAASTEQLGGDFELEFWRHLAEHPGWS